MSSEGAEEGGELQNSIFLGGGEKRKSREGKGPYSGGGEKRKRIDLVPASGIERRGDIIMKREKRGPGKSLPGEGDRQTSYTQKYIPEKKGRGLFHNSFLFANKKGEGVGTDLAGEGEEGKKKKRKKFSSSGSPEEGKRKREDFERYPGLEKLMSQKRDVTNLFRAMKQGGRGSIRRSTLTPIPRKEKTEKKGGWKD